MSSLLGAAAEPAIFTAAALAREIRANAGMLRARHPGAVPAAFWDFDGTLIEGDCSDGLQRPDGVGFAGLIEKAIAAGYSSRFPASAGVAAYRVACREIVQREGAVAANAFIARMFAGAPALALGTLARQHFSDVMGPWMFADALEIWRSLEEAGVRCFVISASPDFFVKGAAETLGVPEDRLHGVRLTQDATGRYRDEVLGTVTYGEGKAVRMREILAELSLAEPERSFWPIASFGNHVHTDGPLLHAVAETVLPDGEALSVLVNAPASRAERLRPATFRSRTFVAVG